MKSIDTMDLAEARGTGPAHGPAVRVPHALLAAEPDMAELAARCIDAAGPEYYVDHGTIEARLLAMSCAQVQNWFTALRRPADAALVARMAERESFTGQMLWDFLTGDPGKIAVHNRLAQLLDSDLVAEIVIGSIRQGFHAPADQPTRTVHAV